MVPVPDLDVGEAGFANTPRFVAGETCADARYLRTFELERRRSSDYAVTMPRFVPVAATSLFLAGLWACAPGPEGITLRQNPRVGMWQMVSAHHDEFYNGEWCAGERGGEGGCRGRMWSWTPDLCRSDPAFPNCAEWRARSDAIASFSLGRARDPWAIGQGVYAMTRDGRYDVADELVAACAAQRWWCTMLRGHVLYERGDALAAEIVLDSAVLAAPHPEACAWSDLTWILDGDAVGPYEASDCQERWRRLDPVWLLADPAWSREGNEAKAAWLGRMAWAELHDDFQERGFPDVGGEVADGTGHSLEHHREVLRGDTLLLDAENAWRPGTRKTSNLAVFPTSRAVADPLRARDHDWDFVGSPEDFRIAFEGGPVRSMPNQISFFERVDSILVVAVAEPWRSPFDAAVPADSAMLVLATPSEGVVRRTPPGQVGLGRPLTARIQRGEYLVGLERQSASGFARARVGHRLPSEATAPLRASDLLLFRPGDRFTAGEVNGLEDVLSRARGAPTWQNGEVVGVYAELYGPEALGDVQVTFSLESLERPGLLRRIGEAAGVLQGDRPLEISWSERPGERFAGAWTLDLSEIEPGRYRITLSAASAVGGEAVQAETARDLVVLPRAGGG